MSKRPTHQTRTIQCSRVLPTASRWLPNSLIATGKGGLYQTQSTTISRALSVRVCGITAQRLPWALGGWLIQEKVWTLHAGLFVCGEPVCGDLFRFGEHNTTLLTTCIAPGAAWMTYRRAVFETKQKAERVSASPPARLQSYFAIVVSNLTPRCWLCGPCKGGGG